MQFSERTKTDASLDITPIVDTVFNLLIFFALSLNFIITPGIKVNLPDAVTEEIIREREEVIIVMDKNDSIFINSNPVSVDQISSVLTKSAQKNKDTLVIIQADQEVSHGKVVRMMDTAKRAGITQLAIATSTMKKTASEKR
jgi:biopolymer transport protein ExbD